MRLRCIALFLFALPCVCLSVRVNSSSECHNIVGNLTGSAASIASAESLVVSSLASFPVYLAFDCKLALRNYLCLGSYTENKLIRTSEGTAAGLCSEACDYVTSECAELLAELPDDNIEGQILIYELTVSCSDTYGCVSPNKTVFYDADVPQCPYPLVVPDSDDPSYPITGTGCAVPCPMYLLTHKEWNIFFHVYEIVTYIGFFVALYMVVRTWWDIQFAQGMKKKPGQWNVMMFSFGCFITSFGALILNIAGPRKVICANNAEAEAFNSVCVTEGYLYAFGSMWASAWGCCSSFEVFLKIVWSVNKVRIEKYRRWYLPLCLLFCLWTVILSAATNDIGYQLELTIPACFIFPYRNSWVQWAAWYGPQTVLVAAALVFMCSTMVTMTKVLMDSSTKVVTTVEQLNKPERRTRRDQLAKVIQYNLRPFLFVVLYVLVLLYLLAFRYYYQGALHTYKEATKEHITCLLTEGMYDAETGTEKCGIVPKNRMPFMTYVFLIAFLSAYGLIPLFVYGIDYGSSLRRRAQLCCNRMMALSSVVNMSAASSNIRSHEFFKSTSNKLHTRSMETHTPKTRELNLKNINESSDKAQLSSSATPVFEFLPPSAVSQESFGQLSPLASSYPDKPHH